MSWAARIAEARDGRVRVRQIGSDTIECDITPSLMRALIDRGYAVQGARKIWRLTNEELATLAVTILAEAGVDGQARDPAAIAIKNQILKSLTAISQDNVSAWAASFEMELCDVEDLIDGRSAGIAYGDSPRRSGRAMRVLDRSTPIAQRDRLGAPRGMAGSPEGAPGPTACRIARSAARAHGVHAGHRAPRDRLSPPMLVGAKSTKPRRAGL